MKIFDSIFNRLLRETRVPQRRLRDRCNRSFKAISVVTVHEYLQGIYYYLFSHNRKLLKIKLERAEAEPARFEILPYTYEVAKTAAKIDASLALRGKTISFSDSIIAATARHYKLSLVTRNTEHFSRIPNVWTLRL